MNKPVKPADLEYDEDGPLYAAMGFVRSSERSSGLTRKRSQEAKPVEKTAEVSEA